MMCVDSFSHLLSVQDLSVPAIFSLMDRAEQCLDFKHIKIHEKNHSKPLQINLFYEPSTRTLCSFEIAGKKLGCDVINLLIEASSILKGESLLDTALTLNAMNPSVIIVRHPSSGAAHFFSQKFSCPIINAGDGTHEHPTQALLDAFTIKQEKGKISDLIVVICGDILHSRVARSNILLLNKMGANVRVFGPSMLLPKYIEHMGVQVYSSFDAALENADVVMMLRMQRERMNKHLSFSLEQYFHSYGLDRKRIKQAKKNVLILHPGPIHRGTEIESCLVESPQSLILKQVHHGVAMRMAVMESLLYADKKQIK